MFMFKEEDTFNIGDEVTAIKDYDFKDDIINVTGKVIGKGRGIVSVFFYKNINGHGGTFNVNKDLNKKLAEKIFKRNFNQKSLKLTEAFLKNQLVFYLHFLKKNTKNKKYKSYRQDTESQYQQN